MPSRRILVVALIVPPSAKFVSARVLRHKTCAATNETLEARIARDAAGEMEGTARDA